VVTSGGPAPGEEPAAGTIGGDRERLTHELHDGPAQTLSALLWQVQMLSRRLEALGLNLKEAREVETLARQAAADTRRCLEILRGGGGRSG